MGVRGNVGMVFQEGALFDSLTVAENVGYRLYEETDQSLDEVAARVDEVLGFVGLREFGERMPSELSGGQRRRVAIARAMASQPAILLYDEATTGLDPITAMSVNDEIIKLRDLNNVTTVIVTHQLRDAFFVASHAAERQGNEIRIVEASPAKADEAEFIMIQDGTVVFEGNEAELRASSDEYIRNFLS
jgi:phospholipid/cholesterol/gamma-HCH transport system ATP-binding protein